ncbi:MAG: hypothetical protein H6Q74_1766 [Firmicutes bacterium]|nr:hypothetical protein [Bacillota bacterium]
MKHQPFFVVARTAATYAGTIIGAGFASGQEIIQFFVSYGYTGLWGIALATLLFGWLGFTLMDLGFKLSVKSYSPVIYYLCGRQLGFLIDLVAGIFLFTTLSIMLAGAATLLNEYFTLPYNVSLIAAAIIIISTVACGVKGISTANMLIAPLLILSLLVISVYSLFYHNFTPNMLQPLPPIIKPAAPHWLLASLLYVSYNLIMGATVLVPLGHYIQSRRLRLLSGLIGGTLLGVLATVLAIVILLHYPSVLHYEVPILQIAAQQHDLNGIIYACTLLAAMYTTAIASLYGCTQKVKQITNAKAFVVLLAITSLAAIFSNLGFATLIRLMFPLFGYATLFFTFRLVWVSFRGTQ